MIRKATTLDWSKIKEIYIEGIETDNATFETAENITTYENWIKSKVVDSYFVSFDENEINGWAALSKVSDRCVYGGVAEVSVYVSSQAQGKGVGSKLMQQLIDFSEDNNIWTLQAGIFPENEASIYLHKKFGFRVVGTREKLGKLKGVWRDVVLMERRSKTIF
jgi:L-amino acid N-acyltransferase YncA